MMDDKYRDDTKASRRNHIIIKKVMASIKTITGNDVTADDVAYITYQLLQQDNSYELSVMDEDKIKEKIIAVIGG